MWNTRSPDYCVTGSSDTTVYFLHGIYGGKEYWQPLTERLVREGYRVVAWDAPGYGISARDHQFSIARAGAVCARLVANTGTRKNVVFGHSMGGQIALRVMEAVPGLVDAFVMCASIGYLANQTEAQRESFFKSRQGEPGSPDEINQRYLELVTSMMAPAAAGPYVDLVKRVASATPAHAVEGSLKAVRETTERDVVNILQSIRVPSLFIAGELDNTGHPEAVMRNAERVAGSQFELLPGCGHYPWAEDPDAFWGKLRPFLARLA